MKFFLVVIVAALIFPANVFAATESDTFTNQEIQYNQQAYSKTLALCSPKNNPFVEEYRSDVESVELIGRGFWSFFWPSDPKTMVTLSTSTSKLIHSDGYWKAMDTCFPTSHLQQRLFTASLIISDIEGHGLGVVAFIFSGLVIKSLEGTAWALAHPLAIAWANRALIATGTVAMLASATSLIYNIHSERELRKHPEQLAQKEEQRADDLHDASYQVMVDRLNQVEYELANNVLDAKCKKFPAENRDQACKDYLAEREKDLKYRINHQQYGKYRNPEQTTPLDNEQNNTASTNVGNSSGG